MNQHNENSVDHREAWNLLPWYVNARLPERDIHRVELHLRACATCRREFAEQRRLQAVMAADPGVEQLPTAGLRRLRRQIADEEIASTDGVSTDRASTTLASAGLDTHRAAMDAPHRPPRRPPPWLGVMAASVAVIAVASSIVAVVLWSQSARHGPSAEFYTVTSTATRPAAEVIRAVFISTITLSDLQRILDDAQLKIVAGPTEDGVYSLARASARPTDWSLQQLRHEPAVRFAEATASALRVPHAP